MYLSNSTKKSTNSETAMLSMWGATKQDVGEIQFGLRSLLCELLWWLKSDGLFGWTIWSLTWMPPFSRWSNVVVVFRCKFFSSDVSCFYFCWYIVTSKLTCFDEATKSDNVETIEMFVVVVVLRWVKILCLAWLPLNGRSSAADPNYGKLKNYL